MEDIIRFLEQLRRHNNREWFEANKLWYRDVKARFDGLVARLIDDHPLVLTAAAAAIGVALAAVLIPSGGSDEA